MNPDNIWKIITLVICLILSALFSASETALMSLSKIRVRQMVENKVKGAERVSKLLKDPSKLLSAILIGNNAVNIGASALMTSLAIDAFGNTGVGIATGIMTLLILIFGEITPKSLAAQKVEKLAVRLSGFVRFFIIILTPIIFILTHVTNFLIKILGGSVDKNKPFITQEELRTIVSVSHKEGALEGEEKDMINAVFDFSDVQVNDVMVPRTEIVAMDVTLSYEEVLSIISKERYSRIPVFERDIDNIIGILYIKDLVVIKFNKEPNFDIRKYLRPPHFTYEFKTIKQLFKDMKTSRTHISIVLNEYGGTEGIVTIEYLIEEIVGEIEDEYDKEIFDVEKINDNEYLVNGSVRLDVINNLVTSHIESSDFDTIAGYVIGIIDRIPHPKEVISYGDIDFIIESIKRNKIEKIRIIEKPKTEPKT